jgi:copper chaperone CopZ
MTHCPASGSAGKPVEPITLESLLLPEYRSRIGDGPWFFCPDPDCSLVYFNGRGDSLDKSTLSVRVGLKEIGPPRPLCYCFDHSLEQIQGDVAATGTSTIPASITEKCRQGLHDCERRNPKGRCCLGDVRAALRAAQSTGPAPSVADEPDCCAAPVLEPPPEGSRTGRLAAGGAVFSAVLSSACCWLPLLLLAFGASAAGVAGFFERYRPVFLTLSGLLLAAGFYLVYFREPTCEPGDGCALPNPRLTRINKVLLWVATLFVATFALFPNYVGVLLGTGAGLSADAPYDLEFAVEGMTCEACASALGSTLADLPGVAAAEVLFSSGQARLSFESPESRPTDGEIKAAVGEAGYRAVLP